jgi:hypothetical protein
MDAPALNFSHFYEDRKGIIDYFASVEGVADKCRVDLTKEYPKLEFLLKRDGTGVFPKGDIQAIKGKAKSGKSTLILTLSAALLKGDFNGFQAINSSTRVVYVDTEQNERNTQLFGLKLYKLCGWDTGEENSRFVAYSLRGETAEMRGNVIEYLIKELRPDIIFIDGIRDLIADFNDIGESNAIVGRLMRLSREYNAAICVVLHENKTDGNMRGHLGTEVTNKCSEVYKVTNDKGAMLVEQTECRNIPVKDFAFTIGADGLPGSWDTPATPTDRVLGEIVDRVFDLFERRAAYKYNDLVSEYMEVSGLGKDTAKKHIAKARKQMLITKGENQMYEIDL